VLVFFRIDGKLCVKSHHGEIRMPISACQTRQRFAFSEDDSTDRQLGAEGPCRGLNITTI
jgi:hypothetical protein